MPFIASNLGGGTLANKVAHAIDDNRAAAERADTEDAIAPTAPSASDYATPTATDAGTYDDDGPTWPDESAERAYLASQSPTAHPSSSSAPATDAEPTVQLPPLDSLVSRIPAETRALLEDLFRAPFTDVRQFSKKLLKKK